MACDRVRMGQLIEAAKTEYRRLADLKKQGYEQDLDNGILDIDTAMKEMHAVAQKRPDKLIERESIDSMFINELNNNQPKDGKKPIKVVSGVKIGDKIEYQVTYENGTKEYTLPAARITADQMSASNYEYQRESTQISRDKALQEYLDSGDKDLKTMQQKKRIYGMFDDIQKELQKVYPEIQFNKVVGLKDENGTAVLGRSIGRLVEVDFDNMALDTIPHEYAHIYINALQGTPTINNALKKIRTTKGLSESDAKEYLAHMMGEAYVNDRVNLDSRTKTILKNLWKFVVKTIKGALSKDAKAKYELDEIVHTTTLNFRTGKDKDVFQTSVNSLGFDMATEQAQTLPKKSKEGFDYVASVHVSSELSEYGSLTDYKNYLESIFPDSQVQDILAHDTGSYSSMSKDAGTGDFKNSWMYKSSPIIDGKGGDFGLVKGEGFYMYKPGKDVWNPQAAYRGYMKVNMKKPLEATSKEYQDLEGKNYYAKMSSLTNTKLQHNPDENYLYDKEVNPVNINSIVKNKTSYDGYTGEVRPGMFEYVAWTPEQVHILGSEKDINSFKKYMVDKTSSKPSMSKNNTLLVPVNDEKLHKDIPEHLVAKQEHHITVLGFGDGKKISKMIEESSINKKVVPYELSKLIEGADLEYELTDEIHTVKRSREAWVDWKDQSKGKTTIHEESVIQLVNAPGIEKLIKDINEKLDLDIAVPMPHITIAVNEGSMGIGIPSKEAFDKLDTTPKQTKEVVDSYGFNEAYAERSRIANKFVADTAVSMYEDADKWLAPRIKKFHNQKMKENGVYSTVYRTVKDGVDNIELIDKIAHTLFLTGDTDRAKIARLTKLVEDTNRWANETLTTEMPEWDKKLLKAIPNEADQKLLTEVYGLSGYGALYQYTVDGKRISEWLNEGYTVPAIIKKMGKISEADNTKAKELMNRLVNQKVQKSQVVNAGFNDRVAALTVLKTMSANNHAGFKLHKKMRTQHKELHNKLEELAISAYVMNGVVNKGVGEMSIGKPSHRTHTDYDGHGLLDLYSNSHEMKVLTKDQMNDNIYTSKTSPWKLLPKKAGSDLRIVFRKSQQVYEEGLGVNTDRIKNGLHVDTDYVESQVNGDPDWLTKNNVQQYETQYGTKRYRMILDKKQAAEAEGMNNVMQSLYRTIVHNTQLTKTHALQDKILDEYTEHAKDTGQLQLLNKKIKLNKRRKRSDRREVKPYLNTPFTLDQIKRIAPQVAEEYKVANGVTSYGGLNKKLRYVRGGLSDLMVGFQSGSIFKDDWPFLQDIERKYKQLVVLKKLKMVVASPTKLIADIVSNSAILLSLDVDPKQGGQDMKDAYTNWNETSKMESDRVKLEMELLNAEAMNDEAKIKSTKAKIEKSTKEFEGHEFYDAYKYGFVQSLASSMMIKEYDTISGLQHTIDEVVKKFTENDKHEPNEVHKAITWWMNAGYGLENILEFGANQARKANTNAADEIMAMAQRLKDKKEVGNEDVAGYISEIIAGPESEVVRQGSRVMQMGDLAARWALYKHTIQEQMRDELNRPIAQEEVDAMVKGEFPMKKEKADKLKETAAMRSLDTFVDYRLNIPSELKTASNLGVLWFPSYWLRNAVVIPQMIASKPLNSMVSIGLSGFTGLPTVYESHPLWKFVNGNLVHPGMDVLTTDTFVLGT